MPVKMYEKAMTVIPALPLISHGVGRRNLLLIGSVTCMVVHYIIAAVMASKGKPVPMI
jgi:hypothetical protein